MKKKPENDKPARRGPGRPRSVFAEGAENVTVPLSPAEFKAVTAAAERAGVPRARWMREVLYAAATTPEDRALADLLAHARQLGITKDRLVELLTLRKS